MPEYLAPGVYVEEVDTGSKPIEGVSTSTAGMLGVTERGPVNIPVLITSYGEYTRWFGERLNIQDFSNGLNDPHCYLAYAVEGFFNNGGKQVYITRVLDTTLATRASAFLFNRGADSGANTVLLRDMAENTGTAANLPLLLVLPDAELTANDWMRIGDGSDAEYRLATVITAPDTVAVPLSLSLSRSHADPAAPITVYEFPLPAAPLRSFTLVAPAPANHIPRGEDLIEVNTATTADLDALIAAAAPRLLRITEDGMTADVVSEYRIIQEIARLSPNNARVRLDSPLRLSYANSATVDHLNVPAAPATLPQLDPSVRAGESLIFLNDRGSVFDDRKNLIVINQANHQEIRRIGELRQVTLTTPITEDYPTNTWVEGVTLVDDHHITMQAANAGDGTTTATSIMLTTATHAAELSVGQTLILGTGANQETVIIASITPATGAVVLQAPLTSAKHLNDPVIPVRFLTAIVRAGANFVAVTNRRGLAVGDVLKVGDKPNDEYVTVTRLSNRAVTGPDPGTIVFAPPLTRDFPMAGTPVVRQTPAMLTDIQPSVLVIDAGQGTDTVLVSDGGNGVYETDSFVRFTTPTGEVFLHRVSAISPAALVPAMVTLSEALRRSHRTGSLVVDRAAMLDIHALDAGAWGNRLRVSIEDESAGLVSRTTLSQIISPTKIRLVSAAGVEAGTILECVDTAGGTVGDPVKVGAINRATNEITLGGAGLTVPQQVVGLGVRSREFRLTAYLLRQPDPINPTRNEVVLDSEVFRYLSMDPRHSRYIESVIGTTWDDVPGATHDHAGQPLRREDHRSEGESRYIRVRDLAQNIMDEDDRLAALENVRLGPEALIDILPDGRQRPARHRLEEAVGDDAIPSLTDATYIGVDDPTPENRTGLHTLRNIEEISIVSCPGRTGIQIQNALINHCELIRYRFAVLDGPQPPRDTLADVQNQRQQFDTKYAALYHPWLVIPNPYPTTLNQSAEYCIPPSGHIVGIYARTDIERGVHKAPANEVVRGIIGLQRLLNKEQQDILNPYPVNINVIRDFRPNNRGIRVFGGRVITMDSAWKYVNVRRLLIFIEDSIDRGLQWVVFEPNAEPLWARVRRSISNFLTLVWRNGALEGTKVEEAYFVKCDRTTMTQTDIDSGRLIVVVGVALVKPAEFVIIRINGLWTAGADN